MMLGDAGQKFGTALVNGPESRDFRAF